LVAALLYLILGLLAQAVTVFDVWLGFNPLAYTAMAATTQLLLLGWLTQLGLALMYERWLGQDHPNLPPAGSTRRPASATLIFMLFNLGLPLVILGQPAVTILGGAWLGALAALGGVLQWLAGLILVREVWCRLRNH
jgi:hypothetical protein